MSRPGSVHRVGSGLTPPAPLGAAAAGALLTLVDAETRLYLGDGFGPARDWIAFHCGAPIAESPGDADFVLVDALPDLGALNSGIDDAPEDGSTVILMVAGFAAGGSFEIAGPGLRVPEIVTVDGLPAEFAAVWADNHARYPCGVDLILCSGDDIVALPRSLRIIEARN
jgi:alpha-D-ribose 1-methylphosphonate 5-triphosphate synthase subunit PhnH